MKERDIDVISKRVYELAVEKGWWDGPERSFGDLMSLVHSEVSEAVESKRNDEPAVWYREDGKPDGWAVELADAVIRIMDLFVREDLSLGDVIDIKHTYNATRPYRHGGKKF